MNTKNKNMKILNLIELKLKKKNNMLIPIKSNLKKKI